VWTCNSNSDGPGFAIGDRVVATGGGREFRGAIAAAKGDVGGWIYELDTMTRTWWTAHQLRHDDDHGGRGGGDNGRQPDPGPTGGQVWEQAPKFDPDWYDVEARRYAAEGAAVAHSFFAEVEGTPALSVARPWAPEDQAAIDAVEAGAVELENIRDKLRSNHTCKSGMMHSTAVTFYEEVTRVAPLTDNDWRKCPACRETYIRRRAAQIGAEQQSGDMFQLTFDSVADWTRQRKAWNKRAARERADVLAAEVVKLEAAGVKVDDAMLEELKAELKTAVTGVRFTPFFSADGRVTVIHNSADDGGELVASDKLELRGLVASLCKNPARTRPRASAGFGGDYRGARGDGRTKAAVAAGEPIGECAQYIAKGNVRKIAGVLSIQLDRRDRGEREVYCLDSFQALIDANVEMRLRTVHESRDILSLLIPMSPLVSISQEPIMDTKGDIFDDDATTQPAFAYSGAVKTTTAPAETAYDDEIFDLVFGQAPARRGLYG
jgi:hypothetical protein